MAEAENILFRSQLLERRDRLESAMETSPETRDLKRLLDEVDAALARMQDGTYGLCEVCHDAIEPGRLMADPLTRYCLDHLSASQRRALQQDLDLAVQIQSALLPSREVSTCGFEAYYHYQAAGPVGGDYCDLIPVQNGTKGLLFLAGDVSGKGVAASLLMSNLHAIFRALYSAGMPVQELVARANRVFCENTMSAFYATLLCGMASESGQVEVCNAGHCPPVLVRDGEMITLSATGLPLGLFCNTEYSVCRIDMRAGDTLVVYTDGLTEARNAENEEYGHERLLKALDGCHRLAAKAVASACITDLQGFVSGSTLADDLTVMVLKRRVEGNRAG
ncbi:MAG TPA: SpoIIE family protein phosphatase [Terriglobales bacterium]|jgi:sigma-B regulation protein RsbU (phosphoserine phosphatase)|nr:SpoIIE family protein phosphatase [Terriglobales bacterium]